MPKPQKTGSITRRTLWKVAVRISLVVAAATVISFWNVRDGLEGQALEHLEEYHKQRQERESAVFILAGENLDTFAKQFEQHLATLDGSSAAARFDTLFESRDDGTTRLRAETFQERGVSGFIGKHVAIDDEMKRRLVAAVDLLSQFGPAWRSLFANLYVVTPDNAVLMYWPEQPWALTATEWEIFGKLALLSPNRDGVVVGDSSDLPTEAIWSDLYFDYGARDWLVSVTEPVVVESVPMLTVGHDVLLHDLIERALTSNIDGTYTTIFRPDGRLIVHPRYMESIQARGGALTIEDTGDPELARIYDLVGARDGDRVILENAPDGVFLAVTQFLGPAWYMITVFPESIVANRAFDTARLILLLGAVALVLEIGILLWVLRTQVAKPLQRLIDATRSLASGQHHKALATDRQDEIGDLAQSFNSMAEEIDLREAALAERSTRLAILNQRLQRELEERRRAEAEIARQREALHQSEKLNALGSLLAGVAHELNNPLSVVVGRSFLLEEQLKDRAEAKAVGQIRNAAERCSTIVKTFLAMARQEAPARESTSVADILAKSLEVTGYDLKRTNVTLHADLPKDLPEIWADPNQLIQVFSNLIVNANQALADCPEPRSIHVTGRSDLTGRRLTITLADNGPGIPEDQVSRVFEPFFTTKKEGEGTGLGLSVCRGLVEAHGGTIDLAVASGSGTTFTIELPTLSARPTAEPVRDLLLNTSRDQRILIVEDEADIAEMLRDVLLPLGHRVRMVSSGKAALALLQEHDFDLILSDLNMPDLDGQRLFEALVRRDPGLRERVVFVTGDSLGERAQRFLAESKRPVIEKPFSPEDIHRIVAEHLGPPDSQPPAALEA